MGTIMLNEYQITFADNHTETYMAENARKAAIAKETDALPIAQLTRVKTGIGVETAVRMVRFKVTVLPEAAETSGCRAAPAGWVVPEGTTVIFTALPGSGFQFTGWFVKDGTEPLSTELTAELTITGPASPVDVYTELEARFEPVS